MSDARPADKTLIELLGVNPDRVKALDEGITQMLKQHVAPGADAITAMLAVAARAAAANGMPFVLAVSVLEQLYNEQARQSMSIIEITPPSSGDKPVH